MAEAAGLVFGVVSLWKTCVGVFDVVGSSKTYGLDYEVPLVELEVERIRLLTWGNAAGLDESQPADGSRRRSSHSRFRVENVRNAVLSLLGYMQNVFEDSARLQTRYGLRRTEEIPEDKANSSSNSLMVLRGIFRTAYGPLRRSAKERQHSTPVTGKATRAIYDQRKFKTMVEDVKGLNDSLEALFPDIKLKVTQEMRDDIDQSEEAESLGLLRQATGGEHDDISECASSWLRRLEFVRHGSNTHEGGATHVEGEQAPHTGLTGSDGKVDELSRQMDAIYAGISQRNRGALRVTRLGPHRCSALVSTSVF